MGVGTADADARSTRASLEADASAMYCESHRRQERLSVCILKPLHGSATMGLTKDARRRDLIVKRSWQYVMCRVDTSSS